MLSRDDGRHGRQQLLPQLLHLLQVALQMPLGIVSGGPDKAFAEPTVPVGLQSNRRRQVAVADVDVDIDRDLQYRRGLQIANSAEALFILFSVHITYHKHEHLFFYSSFF